MVICQNQLGVIITVLCFLFIEQISAEDGDKPCTFLDLDQCEVNESCEQTDPIKDTGLCVCIKGFARLGTDKKCTEIKPTIAPDVPPTISPAPSTIPDSNGSHIVLGILIPLVLVALVMCLVYAAKRYQWLQRLRAMRQRRYDEVQFGQEEDDPPLA